MKKILIALGIIIFVGGAIGAAYYYFKGSDKHLQLIPANAVVVGSIDYVSLAAKADLQKIQQMQFFKDMEQRSKNEKSNPRSEKWMEIAKNPFSSGINLMSDIYFFVVKEGSSSILALDVDIKDEAQFRGVLKKFFADSAIKKEAGFSAIYDENWSLAWNEKGLLVAKKDGYDEDGLEMKKFFTDAFGRKKNESIMGNKFFKEYDRSKKDISFFVNASEYLNVMAMYAPLSSNSTLSKVLKSSYYVFNLSFEDNRVHSTWNIKTDNKEFDKINYMNDKGVSDELMKCMTSKDVYVLSSMSVNTGKMFSMFDEMPYWKEMIKNVSEETGIQEKDLKAIFGGDIAFSLNDFAELKPEQMSPEMMEYYQKVYGEVPSYMMPQPRFPRPVFSLNFSSNNKEGVKKLVAGKMFTRPDNIYFMQMDEDYSFYMVENKKGYTFTNDSMLAKNIAAGITPVAVRSELNDQALKYPVNMFMSLNFNNYPQPLRDYVSANIGGSFYNGFMTYTRILKDFNLKGKITDGEASLDLTEGQGNSLYRLIAQADEVYRVNKAPSPL